MYNQLNKFIYAPERMTEAVSRRVFFGSGIQKFAEHSPFILPAAAIALTGNMANTGRTLAKVEQGLRLAERVTNPLTNPLGGMNMSRRAFLGRGLFHGVRSISNR